MAILDRKTTKDNHEMQIGINHFGHFYLTYLLWDKLKQSGNPRIVNVSSSAHMSINKSYDIDFSNIHYQNGSYSPYAAYSHSKKANILFTK
jgi:NAD(P)-dependent dehydrogenase (short-subunit alcohol dehydrogenase family)